MSDRREFLQLAQKYSQKSKVGGWYISEKLDGSRCFWDGGITRGMKTEDVPYASIINPKTGERKTKIKPIATGLWSRYGNPIIAPGWFLDQLPKCLLDGELWAGRGKFQLCRSITAGDEPDERFNQVKFCCYGSPSPWQVFKEGEIKNSNFHSVFKEVAAWYLEKVEETIDFSYLDNEPFDRELQFIRVMLEGCNVAHRCV